MSEMTYKLLAWLGIVVGVIGFFFAPIWLGIVAVVLGLVSLASSQKVLAWLAIIIGVIVLLIQFFN
ncbi:MAG: C4-dicarboxylate ABC transporter [Bacillota bacterium]|nr:C4-dicarboxylate ABC transporter [Bacillota bacterium]